MKYSINKENYRSFAELALNRLPQRSWFVPFASREEAEGCSPLNKRYSSSLVECLNGEWDFKYYPDPKQLPSVFDTEEIEFDKIKVPSCWQFSGFGRPAYINLRYPFKYDPPHIPETEPVRGWFSLLDGFKKAPEGEMNHAGVYRRKFEAEGRDKKYVICFLGVSSFLDVYCNGSFVGCSECSHNMSEFELTPFIKEGENELLCVVRRWCCGSYLECQDMFRNSGIFRDVLLRKLSKDSVRDIDFKTEKKEGFYSAKVNITLETEADVKVCLEGHGLRMQAASSGRKEAEFVFEGLEVLEWNAELPELYTLSVETESEYVETKVGFKTVEIRGDTFLLNGRKIKLHGVNHHDSSPKTGYYMPPEEIERDVLLCKEYNIDTIRTSHYAPDPLLIELAALYGVYIIDEVDIETHGAFIMKFPPSYNRISNDPVWMPRYLDRAKYHYGRDKLISTPVIIWSLGNECGAGCNTDAMYDYFKSVSPLPVHCESAVHNSKIYAYDIGSNMYPEVSKVKSIGLKQFKDSRFHNRPYFMCEYAHAMGTGPGNIEQYWDEIYARDGLMGGCVWEFADHAVLQEDGSYTYGGDHGEWIHDGNFCCDGIFYPDRSPSTGAIVVKHCYSPLRLRLTKDRRLEILNTTGFTPGNAFTLRINISGKEEQEIIPSCPPLEKELIDLGLHNAVDECFINITVIDKKGTERSEYQFVINESIKPAPEVLPQKLPSDYPECETILFRAPTDNDVRLYILHPMNKWLSGKTRLISESLTENGRETVSRISFPHAVFLVKDRVQSIEGGVLVSSGIHCAAGLGYLPRFGKVFKLPLEFSNVKWFGTELEAYEDMQAHTVIKECSCSAETMNAYPIKPQESGNRMQVRYASLTDENGKGYLFEAVDRPFCLGIKTCSDRTLSKLKHREEIPKEAVYVSLSTFQQGLGTGSCGPYILKEHRFPLNRDYEIKFKVKKI